MQPQTVVVYDADGMEMEHWETVTLDDGIQVEVKRPREKARQGGFIHACRFCDYSGQSELGLLPRPATKPAEFCPSCRGPVHV